MDTGVARVARYPGTLSRVAAELNPEGTDYLPLADDPPEAALPPALEKLRRLLRKTPAPLTRQEILARWPEGEPPPRADSLWRSLTRGGAGTGRFLDPLFRLRRRVQATGSGSLGEENNR